MLLIDLFDEAIEHKASDIHLASGDSPRLRVDHGLVTMDKAVLDREGLERLLEPMLTPEARLRLEAGSAVEQTIVHREFGFVGIAFRFQDNGLAATFRVISNGIPTLDAVAGDALELFQQIANSPRGLVLIVGPTGSGKWTTACAIVEHINASRADRIFVVVDHPSYMLSSKKSMLTELHVGVDCESYERGMQIAHQSDLDVIALNDLPTLEAVRQAVIVAETGHLVIVNLHAEGCVDALARILSTAGPEDEALRRALAKNLIAVTSQKLLLKKDGSGRVPAYEYLRNTPEVADALVDGNLEELQRIIDSNSACRSMSVAVERLVADGKVAG